MWQRHGKFRRWTAAFFIWAVLCAGGSKLRAQDGGRAQDEPPELPAGAQMVRGTVTSSTLDALTIKVESGELYKVTVTPNTRVMKARQPVKLTEIKAGDGVGAMGVMDASTKTLHAMFVTVVDAEQIKKAQADLGKTYILGEVTAMDDLKLTIKRPDGVSQTIAVDEGTSFRRGGRGMGGGRAAGAGANAAQRPPGQSEGGESITLADIKVGDSVIGRGALKAGVFVPTELRVMDRAARARRREGASDAGTTPPSGVQR